MYACLCIRDRCSGTFCFVGDECILRIPIHMMIERNMRAFYDCVAIATEMKL